MWISYWKEILFALVVVSLSIYIQWVHSTIHSLEIKVSSLEHKIDLEEQASELLYNEYLTNIQKHEKEKVIVKKVYEDRVQVIYHWGEENATAENAIKYLNNYVY